MTKLYVCEISNLIEEVSKDMKSIEKYFDKLETQRIEYILKSNIAAGRARALGASYLLLFVLRKTGIILDKLPDFSYTEEGKPYLKEYSHVYFNLSHTRNIITCVISDKEVGMDVEHVREFRENTIQRVFTKNEKLLIGENKEELVRFWTMKEAYVKLLGTGIADIWEGIEISKEETGFNIKKLNQDITKAICCKIIADGKLSDSKDYPYYYSVCAKTEQSVDIVYTKWDNHQIEEI